MLLAGKTTSSRPIHLIIVNQYHVHIKTEKPKFWNLNRIFTVFEYIYGKNQPDKFRLSDQGVFRYTFCTVSDKLKQYKERTTADRPVRILS